MSSAALVSGVQLPVFASQVPATLQGEEAAGQAGLPRHRSHVPEAHLPPLTLLRAQVESSAALVSAVQLPVVAAQVPATLQGAEAAGQMMPAQRLQSPEAQSPLIPCRSQVEPSFAVVSVEQLPVAGSQVPATLQGAEAAGQTLPRQRSQVPP